jgi:hypothetical protein
MRWNKLGPVWAPCGHVPWANSHAAAPTAHMLDDDRIRVYISIRDSANVSRLGWVDVAADDPTRVLAAANAPVLDVGEAGSFDDSGVVGLSLVEHRGRLHLFYVGFELGVRVRYRMLIGLAVSDDGGETFRRRRRVPILERSDEETQTRAGPCALREQDGTWRLWYAGGGGWVEGAGKALPTYRLRHLESASADEWGPVGRVVMDFANADEFGFGRPFVVHENGIYKMWYSIRTFSKGYRLGYAESLDGLTWTRLDDQAGIDVSPTGWDSQMMCYACIQATRYGTYMFYNGNDYGGTGFGVAVRED